LKYRLPFERFFITSESKSLRVYRFIKNGFYFCFKDYSMAGGAGGREGGGVTDSTDFNTGCCD
jgi:hypothetical protein